ncbi:MAG: 2-C-methyl-D-erythritol 2,4-cyclodiphosphate synthase [Bacteroidales bacterium]|nr:2-C-methyl-D-erythritol 2,4-cyclodiphosphate synthase [Bacteroidales bacterium]
MNLKIGQGIVFHRLENGLSLWIGGILIPSEKGCVAHSDGDVLLHAVCDALLGAAGLKDIGHYFPDTSEEFRNIDSKILLGKTFGYIREKGFRIVNIDSTILLEKPKIYPYIDDMKSVISSILDIQPDNISIKATTTEKMGPVGREEGITATAVVLLEKD